MLIEHTKMRRAGSPELPFDGPPFYPPLPLYTPPDDSGIDSDDTSTDNQPDPDIDIEEDASDSSSTDFDPVPRSPAVRYLRVSNGDKVIEAIRLHPGEKTYRLPLLLPPRLPQRRKDGYLPVNQSPERSASPLYEVELTASEEDDDASLLELVIPAPPSRYIKVPTSPSKVNAPPQSLFSKIFCCSRR